MLSKEEKACAQRPLKEEKACAQHPLKETKAELKAGPQPSKEAKAKKAAKKETKAKKAKAKARAKAKKPYSFMRRRKFLHHKYSKDIALLAVPTGTELEIAGTADFKQMR